MIVLKIIHFPVKLSPFVKSWKWGRSLVVMTPQHLVQRRHAGHVDPVQVYLHAGAPQHVHDRVPVTLLDVVLEHNLVGEPDSPLARVESGEHTGPPWHDDTWSLETRDTCSVCITGSLCNAGAGPLCSLLTPHSISWSGPRPLQPHQPAQAGPVISSWCILVFLKLWINQTGARYQWHGGWHLESETPRPPPGSPGPWGVWGRRAPG